MAVHKKLGKAKYKCETCQKANDYHRRGTMRCGYVRQEHWGKQQASWGYMAGSPILAPKTCPGYTTRLPEVAEIAEAWAWWEKGQLGMLSNIPQSVAHLVSLFNGEIVSARAFYLDASCPGS